MPKHKYEVVMPEIHYAVYTVWAESKEDAKRQAEGETPDSVEYSHTDSNEDNYKVRLIEE